jgi:hypothetical protein
VSDWRSDPGWVLVEYDPEIYPEAPARPTPAAELAQPPLWASEYRRARPVATWFREIPVGEKVRRELARKAARRTGVDIRPTR